MTNTDIGFAPKVIIPRGVRKLEILSADKAETYGRQISLKLRVVGGENSDHTFVDYANRDEDTGQIKSRRIDLSRDRRQLGVIRNLDAAEFDYLIGVVFSRDFSAVEAYKVPHAVIRGFARFSVHQNGYVLHLRGSILEAPGVENISLALTDDRP